MAQGWRRETFPLQTNVYYTCTNKDSLYNAIRLELSYILDKNTNKYAWALAKWANTVLTHAGDPV